MNKNILLLCFLSLLLVACDDKNTCKIEGTFETSDFDGKYMYLQTGKDIFTRDLDVLDSVEVKGGKFTLKSKVEGKPRLAILSVGKYEPSKSAPYKSLSTSQVVLEEGTVQVSFKASSAKVVGTPLNDKLNLEQQTVSSLSDEIEAHQANLEAGVLADDVAEAKEVEITGRIDAYNELRFNLIKENMDNTIGHSLFVSSVMSFSTDQVKELLEVADSDFRERPEITQLQQMLEMQDAQAKKGSNLLYDKYIDGTVVNLKGQKVSLSSLVGTGKFVLLDFWASWCKPCLDEIPNLKAVYKDYKAKGFEIVAISIDENKTAWTNMVKKQGMNWIQTIDADGSLATAYGVTSIPFTVLISPEGKVIKVNLRGGMLEDQLEELIQ